MYMNETERNWMKDMYILVSVGFEPTRTVYSRT